MRRACKLRSSDGCSVAADEVRPHVDVNSKNHNHTYQYIHKGAQHEQGKKNLRGEASGICRSRK